MSIDLNTLLLLACIAHMVRQLFASIPDAAKDWLSEKLVALGRSYARELAILFTVAVAAAVVLLLKGSDDMGIDRENHLGDRGEIALAALGGAVVPHYWPLYFVDESEQTLLPIPDCAYADFAELLQQSLLDRSAYRQVLDQAADQLARRQPVSAAGRTEAQQRVMRDIERRKRASMYCALTSEYLHTVTDPINDTVFERHTEAPVFWSLPDSHLQAGLPLTHVRVRHILMARNHTMYVRVLMVRQAAGASVYRLQTTLVSVADLLQAVQQWSRRLDELLGKDAQIVRCLCMPHFGIVGSGMFYHYSPQTRRWALMFDADVTANHTYSGMEETAFTWNDRPLAFPATVDVAYGIDRIEHYSKFDVAYVDEKALNDGAFDSLVREIDPLFDIHYNSTWPFAIRVPLLGVRKTVRRYEDADSSCYQHCLAMEEKSMGHLKRVLPQRLK